VTPVPDPLFDLVGEVREFLVQSLARPRGTRGQELLAWHGEALWRCYQRIAIGVAPPGIDEEFPDLRYRMAGRYKLARPRRTDPEAPPELAEVVAAFRQAGWFETSTLDPGDLARAARTAWRTFEREDIPLTAAEMAWRLLLLDTGRTWSEDAHADVRPGDEVHLTTLFAIGQIGGKGFGPFYDPEENWTSNAPDVLLSFRWGRTAKSPEADTEHPDLGSRGSR
jgi:hypothetical protein